MTPASLKQRAVAPRAGPTHGGPLSWLRPAAAAVGTALVLGLAYYGAGRASLALQYAGPVAAVWLPSGLAAAILYLVGLQYWPAVLVADVALADLSQPLATRLALTVGDVADVVIMAVLLRRLLGPRARLTRLSQVGGLSIAVAAGATVTASFATAALGAGHVIAAGQSWTFYRSWLLADASGSLLVIGCVLAWAGRPPDGARARWPEWVGTVSAVVALSLGSLSQELPLTYLVFPALIWAAVRLGPRGATLGVVVAAGMAVAITAHQDGAFVTHSISANTLALQLYVAVAALTTVCLAAAVAERHDAAVELADAERRAAGERRRIARDLHDSLAQSLYAATLKTRTADRAARGLADTGGTVRREVAGIAERLRAAQAELRAVVLELRPNGLRDDGLVAALRRHADGIGAGDGLVVRVHGPEGRIPLAPVVEQHLYRIGQEALANVVRHARATTVSIDVSVTPGSIALTIRDDGRGFDPAAVRRGGFGLRSMRTRAEELEGRLDIDAAPGRGTTVRAELPTGTPGDEP